METPNAKCCCCGSERPLAQMFRMSVDPALCDDTCNPGDVVCPDCARRGLQSREELSGTS